MDGVEAFKEGLNHVPHPLRTRIFRLDHALADLPRLDDVTRVAELAKEPYTVPDQLVRAVLATCFFVELDEGPTRAPGQYVCRGSVLCARREPRRIIERVLVEFPGAELQTGRGEHLGRSDDDDGSSQEYHSTRYSLEELPSETTFRLAITRIGFIRPFGVF
ncbi:hypothetical protein CBS147353_11851 [Aspergillus niger]|nr:hypothetical protein CBS147353_11851 [Aspergillus niger]